MFGFDGCGGVAGAELDGPVEVEVLGGLADGLEGVVGEGFEGCDPEDAEGRGGVSCGFAGGGFGGGGGALGRAWFWGGLGVTFGFGEGFGDGSEPGGEGFSDAGGGVDEAAFAVEVGLPGLALKGEGFPAACAEPGFDGVHGARCPARASA